MSYVDYRKTYWAKSEISRVKKTSGNVYGFDQTKLIRHSGDIVDHEAGDSSYIYDCRFLKMPSLSFKELASIRLMLKYDPFLQTLDTWFSL